MELSLRPHIYKIEMPNMQQNYIWDGNVPTLPSWVDLHQMAIIAVQKYAHGFVMLHYHYFL